MASAEDTEAQSDNGIYSFQAAPKRSGGRGGKIKSVTLADLASVQGQLRELSGDFPRTVETLQGPGECWDTDPGNAGQRVVSLEQGTGRGEVCPAWSNLLHMPVIL